MIPKIPVPRLVAFSLVLGTLALGARLTAQGGTNPALAGLGTAEHVPGEVLVQFRAGTGALAKSAARALVGATPEEVVLAEADRADAKGDLERLRVPAARALAEIIRTLEKLPVVEFAEPNWIYHHTATSNDPYYTNGSLWGMYGDATSPANANGCQAGEAWAAGNTGSNAVYVGVIDEGLMHTHTELAANVWTNPYDPVDGIDNDQNGYVDDIRGWDFVNNNNSTYDGKSDDHGTHVAGTIGAKGGNGSGVAGVCWNVTLISCKFLGASGGTTSNAVKAIDYLTNLKARKGLNIVASNNSWGGGGYSQSLYDAIQRANVQNILFCAAAGNGGSDGVGDNDDAIPFYPASYTNTNIIAVASITSSGAKSGFSNYGATSVDLAAPGSSILSTVPANNGTGSAYAYYQGTSMATPHVTGAVALYAASHPGSSAATIKNAILSSAIPTASMAGKCVTGGRLNVGGF